MAFSIPTYDSIKSMIAGQEISMQVLDDLKQDFAGEIGSKRRLTCVNSLADLLDILERRDVINEANIGPLQDICHLLQNKELICAISHYNAEEEYEYENEYALERIQHETQEKLLVEKRKSGVLQKLNENTQANLQEPFNWIPDQLILAGKKRDEVFDLIAKEIGREWRSFGREIGMRGEMNNLESDYPRNSKEKIRKMLELFEEDQKVEPTKMVSCICAALAECRRKDLCDDIEEILMR